MSSSLPAATATPVPSPEPDDPAAPRRRRLPSLTGLRFVAAACVFFFHASFADPPQNPFADPDAAESFTWMVSKAGWAGVSFFFVLSGFILTWTASAGDTRRAFWRRRAAKIYPLHAATWALAMLLYAGASTPPGTALLNLALLHSWSPVHDVFISVNPPSWSLCSEVLFYALFPFVLPVVQRIARERLWFATGATVAGIVTVAVAVQELVPSTPRSPEGFPISSLQFWLGYNFPPLRLGEFVLGMLLARLVIERLWPRTTYWQAVGLCAAGYAAALGAPFLLSLRSAMIVPIGFLVATAAISDARGQRTWLWSPTMQWLGRVSFAFYLVQYPLMYSTRTRVFDEARYGTPMAIGVLLGYFMATLVAGWLLHRFVEEPVMRRWARPRPSLISTTTGADVDPAHHR